MSFDLLRHDAKVNAHWRRIDVRQRTEHLDTRYRFRDLKKGYVTIQQLVDRAIARKLA